MCCLTVHCSQKWKPNCRQLFRTRGHYIFNNLSAIIPEVMDSNLDLLSLGMVSIAAGIDTSVSEATPHVTIASELPVKSPHFFRCPRKDVKTLL